MGNFTKRLTKGFSFSCEVDDFFSMYLVCAKEGRPSAEHSGSVNDVVLRVYLLESITDARLPRVRRRIAVVRKSLLLSDVA